MAIAVLVALIVTGVTLRAVMGVVDSQIPGRLSNRQRTTIIIATLTLPAIPAAVLIDTPAAALATALVFAICPAVAAVDLIDYRIPNRLTYPTYATTAIIIGTAGLTSPTNNHLAWPAGMAIGSGTLMAIHLISPTAMGYGDVKLMGLLGGPVGFCGLALIPITLGTASFLGVCGQIFVRRTKPEPDQRTVPFGPYLAIAAYLTVIAHQPLLQTIGAT